jgi:hypothetical protein
MVDKQPARPIQGYLEPQAPDIRHAGEIEQSRIQADTIWARASGMLPPAPPRDDAFFDRRDFFGDI